MKLYRQLTVKQQSQVAGMFDARISGEPDGYVYELTRDGDVLSRKSKSASWTYRGYKIHWNHLKDCWRWYERIGDRVDAIDTMTPERDIDHVLEMKGGAS